MPRFQGCDISVKSVTLHLCKTGKELVGATQKQHIRMSSEGSLKTENGEIGCEVISIRDINM